MGDDLVFGSGARGAVTSCHLVEMVDAATEVLMYVLVDAATKASM
jgi:hypothetical protein